MHGGSRQQLDQVQNIRERITGATERTFGSLPEIKEHIAEFKQEVQLATRQFSTDRANEHHKERREFYEYWTQKGIEQKQRER
jgi:hypothetical protein